MADDHKVKTSPPHRKVSRYTQACASAMRDKALLSTRRYEFLIGDLLLIVVKFDAIERYLFQCFRVASTSQGISKTNNLD